jgi:hypothetical protein
LTRRGIVAIVSTAVMGRSITDARALAPGADAGGRRPGVEAPPEGTLASPGSGVVAARTLVEAAGLVELAGRAAVEAGDWPDARAAVAQASALAARAGRLAVANAEALARARLELDRARRGTHPQDLEPALRDAAAVPLRIAETAADVLELASLVAARSPADVAVDAAAAATLATAAARVAASLVAVNLVLGEDDPLAVQARALVARLMARAREVAG